MIADEDSWTGLVEVIFRINDGESDSGSKSHDPFERTSCSPLCNSLISHEPETDGDNDAIAGTEKKADVGSQ